ncbi:MAG: hypothetical protein LC803_15955 [Acidobacteria bacterium]|nr:hypothetical protein [Acidobacteriota bacterium]
MNCRQFTSLIVEAARGRMMDAAARDGAMRHVEICAACGARLAQERNLTGALRAVAAGMKDLSAPARVETKLLAAFRRSLADSQAAATTTDASPMINATPAPVALPANDDIARRTSSRRQTWRTAFTTTAIAASLTLVALVTFDKQFTQTAPPSPEMTTRVAPQDGKEQSPVAPVIATLPPSPSPAAPTGQAKHDRPQPGVRAASQRTSPKMARAATPRMIASRQVIDGGRAIFAPGEGESAANHAGGAAKPGDAESVTEFLPLVAGAPAATPLEGGQLVRVRLPRAALASLGLPLNAERGNEPVKADVLVGNDGLARAIRFVR